MIKKIIFQHQHAQGICPFPSLNEIPLFHDMNFLTTKEIHPTSCFSGLMIVNDETSNAFVHH